MREQKKPTATVSGVLIDAEIHSEGAQITLSDSTHTTIIAGEGLAKALADNHIGKHIHLAGERDEGGFTANAILPQHQAKKHVGEVIRTLRNGTLRITLTDGRGCTSVPSTVKARQTSAPLRPGDRVCAVGFEIEPSATQPQKRNPNRVFLDAFYVRKIRQ